MEILDVLDENGNVIGKDERKNIHEKGLWHTHVAVWLMNEDGELLFQQRSKNKKVNPLKWTRTGGHVDSGETPKSGIIREANEEIGIVLDEKDLELVKIEKNEKYNETLNLYDRIFVYIFFAYTNKKIEDYILQKEEVADVKYITIEEMERIYKEKNEEYTLHKWEDITESIEYLKKKREELKK